MVCISRSDDGKHHGRTVPQPKSSWLGPLKDSWSAVICSYWDTHHHVLGCCTGLGTLGSSRHRCSWAFQVMVQRPQSTLSLYSVRKFPGRQALQAPPWLQQELSLLTLQGLDPYWFSVSNLNLRPYSGGFANYALLYLLRIRSFSK